MDKLYEMIGRKQQAVEELDAKFDQILGVLADVVSGKIAISRVMVNKTARQVTIEEEGKRPAMPSTVNGLPECVVAPEAATE